MPERTGTRRKSPAPSLATRSATSRSGSVSCRAVTVAIATPVPADTPVRTTASAMICTRAVPLTSRHDVYASGAPTTRTLIAVAISVDHRILDRIAARYAGRPALSYTVLSQRIEAEPNPSDRGDPAAADLTAEPGHVHVQRLGVL